LDEIGEFFRIQLTCVSAGSGFHQKLPEKLTDFQKKIVRRMLENPNITYMMLTDDTGKSKEAVRKNIQKLKSMGLVSRIGPDKGGYWQVKLPKENENF